MKQCQILIKKIKEKPKSISSSPSFIDKISDSFEEKKEIISQKIKEKFKSTDQEDEEEEEEE